MAHITADRILETSTSVGTGAIVTAGAVVGYRPFSAKMAVGDTCHYLIYGVDPVGRPTGEYEFGRATYSAANTLTRTTVTGSSNADAAVNFSAGTKNVALAALAPTTAALMADWLSALGAAPLTGGGTSGTWPISVTGNAGTATAATRSTLLLATDNRIVDPADFSSAASPGGRVWFSSKTGMETGTAGTDYVDLLTLNSYTDTSSGVVNGLAFRKAAGGGIFHYQGTWNAATWNAPKQLAYTDAVEPLIAAGTTAQYRRGDKSWQDFATSVRAAVLTGLSTATNAIVAATDTVVVAFGKLQKQISDHLANTGNPHGVTKSQVGLGNVDNTSDVNKPISTAVQSALNAKAGSAGASFTGPVGFESTIWAHNGYQWDGASMGLSPTGYTVNGPYRQNPIVSCVTGTGDISEFSSYHQPSVESFFQMNVGGGGNYFRFKNDGWASSNGGWATHSSVKTKRDIRRLDRVRERVMGIPTVLYKRRSDPAGKDHIGTISEGAEGTNPEVISEVNGVHVAGRRQRRKIKVADYGQIGVVALAGVQELYGLVDRLEARVAELEAAQ